MLRTRILIEIDSDSNWKPLTAAELLAQFQEVYGHLEPGGVIIRVFDVMEAHA
jgi:hypothetical protein